MQCTPLLSYWRTHTRTQSQSDTIIPYVDYGHVYVHFRMRMLLGRGRAPNHSGPGAYKIK